MNSKRTGDISEAMVAVELLIHGFDVLKPYGDRLPYDLAIDVDGTMLRLQIKTAYYDTKSDAYMGNTRRARTNRKKYSFIHVDTEGADFFIYAIQEKRIFYVIPSHVVAKYKSICYFTPHRKRNGDGLELYKDAWEQLREMTRVR